MYNPEHKYTLEEYWKLVEMFPRHKYEYVRGHIRMMTGGSPAHGQIAVQLSSILYASLRGTHCHVYSSDVAVQLFHDAIYFPDVSVSCDPADWTRKKALESPSVVVEIMSPSTAAIDKGEKFEAYRSYPTIQDFVLIDSRRCYVEHHHRMTTSKWEVSYYTDRDKVIDLASIDVQVPVRDIYLDVYLELEDQD